MTDAELATLKPGDWVRCLVNAGRTGESVDCVVTAIDRRRVHVRTSEIGLSTTMDAEFVTPLPSEQQPIGDTPSLPSLEPRWRALTDEVLMALRRLTGEGAPLDAFVIQLSAEEHVARAALWRLAADGMIADAKPAAICTVGTAIEEPS